MTTKKNGRNEKRRPTEPRAADNAPSERTALEKLKGKLLTKLKKDDPNIYPLY